MPRLTEKAVEWIGRQKGSSQPFFLYFPWTSPHAPIVPAKEFQGKTKAGGYGDYVFQSDWSAGQVLDALDKNGFRDNTLVIFTSDNGPEKYAFDRIRNSQHRSMGPLRGVKRDIWEGGHRIPLVVRWPGVVEPGGVSDALISQIDLMATIASVVGYDLPDTAAEDSYDMLPLLKGKVKDRAIRRSLVHNTQANHYAIRQDEWVLIDAKSGEVTKAPEWYDQENGYQENPYDAALFNIRQDIAERKNLMTEYPAKVAELRALLQRIRQQGHSAPRLSEKY